MHGRNVLLFLCPKVIIFLWWLRHISLQKRPKRALYQRPTWLYGCVRVRHNWKHWPPLNAISLTFILTLGSFCSLEDFQPLLGINCDSKERASVFLNKGGLCGGDCVAKSQFLLGDLSFELRGRCSRLCLAVALLPAAHRCSCHLSLSPECLHSPVSPPATAASLQYCWHRVIMWFQVIV